MSAQPLLFDLPRESAGPEQIGAARVSEIQARQILTKGTGSVKYFDYCLNPYVGCGFGCTYCYAAFFQPDPERFGTWGQWIEIKANAESLLKKCDLFGRKVLMSSATDPYQPHEAKVRLSRRLVELMSDPFRQPRLFVQTRSPLVTRDIDLFKRFRSIRVGMSVTTDSEEVRKQFEPSCASIDRRLEALAELKAAGVPICVSLCPLLPIEDPEKFAARISALEPDHYWTGFFHSSDRLFAASTRQGALEIAARYGWDKRSYLRTIEALKKSLPEIH